MAGWVGQEDIGIPAQGLFLIVFTGAGYLGLCGVIHVYLARLNAGKGVVTTSDSIGQKLLKSPQFWCRFAFVILAAAVGGNHIAETCGGSDGAYCNNWHLMYWYSLAMIVTANISLKPHEFYLGEGVSFVDTFKFYFQNKPLPTEEETEKLVQAKYFKADDGSAPSEGIGFWTLMPSVFITWIFAKSIRNTSVLGARFGMLGGVAYCSWYLSFFSSGIVCYFLRTKYGFKSLPTAIRTNYGDAACLCFQLCVLFRIFNEVWSNATVIGGFYGASGSSRYWGAAWFSVLVPTVYVTMGGMRSSLFSDVFQAALAVLFLVVVLGTIASDTDFSEQTNAFAYSPSSLWGVDGWQPGFWAYTIAGCIGGIISYPWFDPVLTDRAFIGKPKTMLLSFMVGGTVAMLFIFFYAVIGVYGAWAKETYVQDCGCSGGVATAVTDACPSDFNPCSHLVGSLGEASDVAWILGHRTYRGAEIFVNLVMITASVSTLDSTFTSASKLFSLEFCGWLKLKGDNRETTGPLRPVDIRFIGDYHMIAARLSIVGLAFISTCFLGYEKDAMKATTVAGMAIMGIGAPIWWMTIWRVKTESRKGWRQAPLAFIIPFAAGWFVALSYYIQGVNNTDRKLWCKEQGDAAPADCVKSAQGWTYNLNVGTYTTSAGEEAQNAYGRYLGVMILGHSICIVLFFVFFAFHQVIQIPGFSCAEVELVKEEEAASEGKKTETVVVARV